LAGLYETETKFINQAVKGNLNRFPEGFLFQLFENEWSNLKPQNATSKSENLSCQSGTSSFHGVGRTLPNVFTEQGGSHAFGCFKS
jgi:hypothetical protein